MVLVFGGSFNPPTVAHLNIIKKLLETFQKSQVLVLPVGNDYQKPQLLDIHHRMHMLALMLKDMDRVILSDLEVVKSYKGTLESLNALNQTYGNLHFVIGSDHLESLKTWINYKTLLTKYPFIVMTRKEGLKRQDAENMFSDLEHTFYFVAFDENISSTEIRKNPQKHPSWLTKEVYQYIEKNNLYKE